MGMAVGDMDQDDDFDLFVTHWIAQENAAFENMHSENWKDKEGNRRMFFMDSAEMLGLGQVSLKMVGWSTGFADFDNDGLDDLWVVDCGGSRRANPPPLPPKLPCDSRPPASLIEGSMLGLQLQTRE